MSERDTACKHLHELSGLYTTAVKDSLERGLLPSEEDIAILKAIKKVLDVMDCRHPHALLKPPK